MDFRHEWKHEINIADTMILRQRLSAVMEKDTHAIDGRYLVRSLYFDDPADRALREKIDGVNRREKFRFRYYNQDPSWLRLEKKSKINGLCRKESTSLTPQEAQSIIDGDLEWMMASAHPLVQELYIKMRTRGLRPKPSWIIRGKPFSTLPEMCALLWITISVQDCFPPTFSIRTA